MRFQAIHEAIRPQMPWGAPNLPPGALPRTPSTLTFGPLTFVLILAHVDGVNGRNSWGRERKTDQKGARAATRGAPEALLHRFQPGGR